MLNFLDLYDLYAEEVFRFALWLSGDRFEAEDITSETFVRIWVRFDSIRTETLKAYLFTIARNIYLKKRRNINKQVPIDDSYPDPHPNPEQLIDSRLELLRIQNTIQKLPEVDRAAFALRVQHELPYAEIARILEISLTAAKVKVHRVRKKLLATSDDKEIG
ncbi:MAG: RNA polymerase sigma factor [Chloroflexota bacterium]|nr:MAG: RNA polymerase sigma factor [Chloroflexota bacterium]